jgi:hypothetical protein
MRRSGRWLTSAGGEGEKAEENGAGIHRWRDGDNRR